MVKRRITEKKIEKYRLYLQREEKSPATVAKYIRDVRSFSRFLNHTWISREEVLGYKKYLISRYQAVSVNSMLAALNGFLVWQGLEAYRVRPLKIQRCIFRPEEQELTKKDYNKLLHAATGMNDKRLYLIMQTLCATGIRVSELSFITVEALREGYIRVDCKNKTRFIWMPGLLRHQLQAFIKNEQISSGPVFINRNGESIKRGVVWKQMKKAASAAGVDKRKVYPHNLRHLFARTFYQMNKDIVKLADILGHSSVETTRIYTMTTGKEYAGCLERLGLVPGST